MKTESIKAFAGGFNGMFTRVAMAGVLAGVAFLATAEPASAQGFSVQFGVGHPYARQYDAPAYGPRAYAGPVYAPPVYGSGFYAERRNDEWLRREHWEREHDGRFHGRPPVYGYYGR